MCTIVIAVQGSVARCMEGVFVWRKCAGHERGHQRPQYVKVCQVHKYVIFACFSVLTTRFVCLRTLTGRLWQCRDVWLGYESRVLCEWVTCEAVEGSGHAGNDQYLCFYMCIWYIC